jgi:hypothetical protein
VKREDARLAGRRGQDVRPVEVMTDEESRAGLTRGQMLQSFRALREERRTKDEGDIVLERIVRARGKRSLQDDLRD